MFHAKHGEKNVYHLLQFAQFCQYHREEKSQSLKYLFLSVHPYHLLDPELTNVLRLMAVKNLVPIPALLYLYHIRPSAPGKSSSSPVSCFSMG